MKQIIPIVCLILMNSCYAPKTSTISTNKQEDKPIALLPAIYDYNPPELIKKDSVPIKFLLYGPKLLGNISNVNTEFLQGFKSNFKEDVKEIILAKGYEFRGLYDNLNSPVYTDFKYADLAFESTIAINIKMPETKMNQTTNPITGITTYSYSINDYATVASLVQLKINTSQGVLLWNKTIPIETKTFLLQSKKYSYYLSNLPENPGVPMDDPGVWNPFVTNLQELYQDILSKIWTQLNTEEIKVLYNQANELKTNK